MLRHFGTIIPTFRSILVTKVWDRKVKTPERYYFCFTQNFLNKKHENKDKLPDNFCRPAMFPPWAAVLVTPSPPPHKSLTVTPPPHAKPDTMHAEA